MNRFSGLIIAQLLFFYYSTLGIFSKSASREEFLSFKYIVYLFLIYTILFSYAIVWQKLLKILPITTLYSGRAVIIIWGITFGAVFFNEIITFNKIIGAILVIIGVVLVSRGGSND